MQLWFARGSDVSIREQLVTQVVLGILSDDLAPGQRLPSTRELARRFHLHPNTISAGYRQLERERWVEFRRGSGVYVRAKKPEMPPSPALALDQMIARLFRSARKLGVSLPAVRSRLRQWLELQPPDHFLLIEPDEELRRILAAEIAQAVSFPVKSCGLDDCPKTPEDGIRVVLPNREATARQLLPAGTELLTLQVSSVPASLAGYLPAPASALVGVASRWPEFLKVARAVLNAAGFHPDSLIFCDAREANWQRGLKQTAAVVCDSLTAAELPPGCRAIPFALLSESSIAELRRYEEFIRQPIETL
ncbi:Transcriptional regulator, GntR family [Candidatus Sulfotelmatobacter kueseliae]|uniref:Transcriptional regulator, GntR family n=1 Tax=Candidatus Sulfotelmatobacter kueseliae TaxID=2042962 RepID=A0A2U3LDK4_9BACT|nr:Transcriptional regulator, GntR family [Candidatus Sulfotelmatobacter kueseliae]